MKELARTTDAVKLSALRSVLDEGGVAALVFDGAAGALWRGVIPQRLMVGDADLPRAKRLLSEAGFRLAGDGDWDL
ncbi:MAG TPA: DUF2007 domain-containing protein [Caulobacteraceae bacterium]